ncbi:MAG: DCC1-like thiol-disulfide oxidoreductase family protein [Cyanobacteria bacterium P01_C01_bin.121]
MYKVIYDGNCNLCVTLIQLLENLDRGQQFGYIPMQDEATLTQLGITAADCEMGMILLAPEEESGTAKASPPKRWQGSDAAEEIGRRLPLGEVFVQAYRALPGMKKGGDRAYEFIRDNRYGLFGQRSETYISDYVICDDDSCEKAF